MNVLNVSVCVPVLLGCFVVQCQRVQTQTVEWIGFSRPLLLDPVQILDIMPSQPCREITSSSPTDHRVSCFQGGEEAIIYFIRADTGSLSLSLSSGHEALTPHCVVMLLLFGYHGAGWCPGQSRGFAFVEFNVIQEATRWMETNQVTLPYTDTCTHKYTNTVGKCYD